MSKKCWILFFDKFSEGTYVPNLLKILLKIFIIFIKNIHRVEGYRGKTTLITENQLNVSYYVILQAFLDGYLNGKLRKIFLV